MNILVTLNSFYLPQLTVMLTSLLQAHPNTEFTVYLAHSSITEAELADLCDNFKEYKINIVPIKLSENFLDSAPVTDRYPTEMYYRIFAAQYLPESLDHILYLDPDIVIINDISELYNAELGDNLFAAASHVNEPLRKINEIRLDMASDGSYINSGVMLMNLALLRREQNIKEVFDYIDTHRKVLFLPDQDIISSIYGDRILELDYIKYNFSDRKYILMRLAPKINEGKINLDWVRKNVSIIHYCGRNKPWKKHYHGNLGCFYHAVENTLSHQTRADIRRENLLFIINPHAGKGEAKNKVLDVIDLFVRNNYNVTVRTTQRSGQVPEIIRDESADYDLVVSCGGDGTLNESVSGILQYRPDTVFAFIPAGTVNDFATSVGVAKNNMLKAAEDIVNGKIFGCDIGVFDKRYFTYIAAFGAFTEVSYQTPQEFKNLFGRAAYIMEGAAHLSNIKSYKLRIKTKNSVIEDNFIFGMISNSISVGGFSIQGSLDVALNDGLLEVLLVRMPQNPLELPAVINAVLFQDFGSEYFYIMRLDHIEIESEEEIAWTLDGEFGGKVKKVEIGVEKQALQLIVPPNKDLPQKEKSKN